MIDSIQFLSRSAFSQTSPFEPFALIQILGPHEGDFPSPGAAQAYLQLRFDDVHEGSPGLILQDGERLSNDAGSVNHQMFPGVVETLQLFGIEQAELMVSFINEQQKRPQPLALLVHCLGGVSRSAAVARFAQEYLGLPTVKPSLSKVSPNPRVLRLLREAARKQA